MIKSSKNKATNQIQFIPHDLIKPNPQQPRVRFDYNELEGLACSIRANGLLQPINVRVLENGEFELISGERRLRAARMIGMTRKSRKPSPFHLESASRFFVFLWDSGSSGIIRLL